MGTRGTGLDTQATDSLINSCKPSHSSQIAMQKNKNHKNSRGNICCNHVSIFQVRFEPSVCPSAIIAYFRYDLILIEMRINWCLYGNVLTMIPTRLILDYCCAFKHSFYSASQVTLFLTSRNLILCGIKGPTLYPSFRLLFFILDSSGAILHN